VARAAQNLSVDATRVSWFSSRVYVGGARRGEISPKRALHLLGCCGAEELEAERDSRITVRPRAIQQTSLISGTGFTRTMTVNGL
jgi:hypothetical protein